MDEKYLELRTKLDYAREVASKKVKQAQKTGTDLEGGGMSRSSSQPSMKHIKGSPGHKSMRRNKSPQHGNVKSKSLKQGSAGSSSEGATDHVIDKIRRLRGQKNEW